MVKLEKRAKTFKISAWKNWMKILENSGLVREDLKLRFIRRESLRSHLTTGSTSDRSELASTNTTFWKKNGPKLLNRSKMSSSCSSISLLNSRKTSHLQRTWPSCRELPAEKRMRVSSLKRSVRTSRTLWMTCPSFSPTY